MRVIKIIILCTLMTAMFLLDRNSISNSASLSNINSKKTIDVVNIKDSNKYHTDRTYYKIIYQGEYKLLNRLLKDDELERLDKDSLMILRNAIFAKYNYNFTSKYIKDHFLQFKWYTPKYNNVEKFLTEIDKKNIKKIKSKESQYAIIPINSKGFSSRMVGIWQDSPVVAAGYSEHYHFFKDGTYEFDHNEMDGKERTLSKLGKWSINGNKLILITDRRVVIVGGEYREDDLPYPDIVGGKIVTQVINPAERRVITISGIEPNHTNNIAMIKIGGIQFWKICDDPKDPYDW